MPKVLKHLQDSAQHLYALAERHEEEGNFDRADELRVLARDLRNEVLRLRREETQRAEPLTQAVPFAELGASY
jgi:hypothetical protein